MHKHVISRPNAVNMFIGDSFPCRHTLVDRAELTTVPWHGTPAVGGPHGQLLIFVAPREIIIVYSLKKDDEYNIAFTKLSRSYKAK